MIYALAATGLNLILGYGGLVSLVARCSSAWVPTLWVFPPPYRLTNGWANWASPW